MITRDEPHKQINVTGYILGVFVRSNAPVLFTLEGIEFLPIFSTKEKADDAMLIAFSPEERDKITLKVITDHQDFIDSVKGKVRLMLDPWLTEHGTTRFTELHPDGMEG